MAGGGSRPPRIMIDERLGNYRIVRPLGEGGMGVVYLAEHEILRRPAAVKMLHAELSQSDDLVERFMREARATAAIQHPGIVEILDCGFHTSGKAYIVMEFLEGHSLGQHLLQYGRMTAPEAILVAGQIAAAVGAAHEHGVVHRDLKPDNVFLVQARLDHV
jgi:serine/threonine protein kinase